MTLAIVSAVSLAACGDESDDSTTHGGLYPSTTSTSQDPNSDELTPDEQEALAAVRAYLSGIADKDWAAVCDAVTEDLQRGLERRTGLTCEESVELLYDTEQFQNFGETFAEVEPESVVIAGNIARVDLGFEDAFPLVREGGEWKFNEE